MGKVWLIKEWHQENFDTKELFCALTVVVVLKFTKNDNYVLHVHFFYKKSYKNKAHKLIDEHVACAHSDMEVVKPILQISSGNSSSISLASSSPAPTLPSKPGGVGVGVDQKGIKLRWKGTSC